MRFNYEITHYHEASLDEHPEALVGYYHYIMSIHLMGEAMLRVVNWIAVVVALEIIELGSQDMTLLLCIGVVSVRVLALEANGRDITLVHILEERCDKLPFKGILK